MVALQCLDQPAASPMAGAGQDKDEGQLEDVEPPPHAESATPRAQRTLITTNRIGSLKSRRTMGRAAAGHRRPLQERC